MNLMNLMKFIPLVMMGKDVADAYKEESGKNKPFYMSRRFIGAAMALVFAAVGAQVGVEFDTNLISSATGSVEALIATGAALYGVGLAIVGVVKKQPK